MAIKEVGGCPIPGKLNPLEPPKKNLRKQLYPVLKGMFFGLVFAGLFSATFFIFAAPPTSKYDFSETLNPSCAAGSTNCTVVPPATYSFGTNNFLGTGNFTGGTVTVGSTTGVSLSATNGALTVAGLKSGSNNENLTFDFETTADTVAIASGTGVSNITWTGNLTLGGNTTVGTLVTRVKTAPPDESDVNGSLVVESGDGGRLYFRYGNAWHYVAQTAGFQIPSFETVDPISGQKIKEGDVVLGMINKTLQDQALHGVWVRWDSVKEKLLAEARGELSQSGGWGTGEVQGVGTETMVDKVKNTLFSLGISAKDGVTSIAQLAVEKLSAKNARMETIEMVDKATGEVYCTWLENGEWVKSKGECGTISASTVVTQSSVPAAVVKQMVQQSEQTAQQAQEIAQQSKEVAAEAARQAAEQTARQVQTQIQTQVQTQVQTEVKQQLQVQQDNSDGKTQSSDAQKNETPAPAFDIGNLIPKIEQPAQESVESVKPDSATEATTPSAGDLIKNATSGLLNAMWTFSKWIFGSSLSEGSKFVPNNIKQSSAGLLQNAKGFIEEAIRVDSELISSGLNSAGAALSIPAKRTPGNHGF